MRNGQKFALAAGVLGFALATTSLAAQDQRSASMPQSMMGMMQGMSQMMGTCNKMMQAPVAAPQQAPSTTLGR